MLNHTMALGYHYTNPLWQLLHRDTERGSLSCIRPILNDVDRPVSLTCKLNWCLKYTSRAE